MNHWQATVVPPPLGDQEVHVWRWSLGLAPATRQGLWPLLHADEQQRAQRFLLPRHGELFVAGRGLLRTILGRYLGQPPQDLQFGYGPHGKPYLEINGQPAALQFNLAHSHELALLAVTRGRLVGIDVERLRLDCKGDLIAEHFFTPGEVTALRQTAEEQRHQAFFTLWTRKEAFIKATGKGLAIPLAAFEVLPLAASNDVPLTLFSTPEETSRWSLRDLDPGDGYRGALAVEGPGWHLWCGEYQGCYQGA